MSLRLLAVLSCVLALGAFHPATAEDEPDAHDYPGLARVKGYEINAVSDKRFDSFVLHLPNHDMAVEGHVTRLKYVPEDTRNSTSAIEIYRTYKYLLGQMNAEILNYNEADFDGLIGRFTRNGKSVFVDINVINNGGLYDVIVIEEKAFHPAIPQHTPTAKP